MAITKHQSEKEKLVQIGYRACYGAALKLGCCYFDSNPKTYVFWKTYGAIVFPVYTVLCLSLIRTCVVVEDHSSYSQILQNTVMVWYAYMCMINCLRFHRNIQSIFYWIGKDFFTYTTSTPALDRKISQIRDEYSKYNFKFVIFWALSCFSLTLFTNSFSILTHQNKDHGNATDGVDYSVPNPLVVPFFPAKTPESLIFGFVIEIAAELVFVAIVSGQDICFVSICTQLCINLKILSVSIKHLSERAEYLSGEESHKEFLNNYLKCLLENVRHHQSIIECFNHVHTWMSPLLLVIFYSGAIMICMAGIVLTEEGSFMDGVKFPTAMILIAELVHVFLYCLFGDVIMRLSSQIGEELYFTSWYTRKNKIISQTQLMMQIRCNVPLTMSSAKVVYANLSAFSQVLSSSYSYFNLVRATRGN